MGTDGKAVVKDLFPVRNIEDNASVSVRQNGEFVQMSLISDSSVKKKRKDSGSYLKRSNNEGCYFTIDLFPYVAITIAQVLSFKFNQIERVEPYPVLTIIEANIEKDTIFIDTYSDFVNIEIVHYEDRERVSRRLNDNKIGKIQKKLKEFDPYSNIRLGKEDLTLLATALNIVVEATEKFKLSNSNN